MSEQYKVVRSYVNKYGLNEQLPDHYKRRDPDEPRNGQKEQLEDEIARVIEKRFRAQQENIREALGAILPGKSSVDNYMTLLPDSAYLDEETERELLLLLLDGFDNAIELFAEQIGFDVEWETIQEKTAQHAREYMTEWLGGLDETTRKALRQELTNFVEVPGYTIGDIVDGLPFDEVRSLRVAITEVTRIYGEAMGIAGKELQSMFPDLGVEKRWFTNRDDRVCPICAPLHNTVVMVGEQFDGGIDTPPAHVNCRCWISMRVNVED